MSLIAALAVNCISAEGRQVRESAQKLASEKGYRGPIDVAISPGGTWIVTANELSSTLSLVDTASGEVIDEVRCGERPTVVVASGDREVVVTCRYAGTVEVFEVVERRLVAKQVVEVGAEPIGLAVDSERGIAYAARNAASSVAVVDLRAGSLVRTFDTGAWPRHLCLNRDATRLAVGLNGESSIGVYDPASGELLYDEPLSGGINMGHLVQAPNTEEIYFPWMIYRSNPINVRNIQRGWVLASRLARVRFDGPKYREAISLDVPRLAVADPYGVGVSADGSIAVVSSSGTQELLIYGLPDLPFVGAGGPGDLIDRRLENNPQLFTRLSVGGRPMGIEFSEDGRQCIVANHTLDRVQIIDAERRLLVREISLGVPPEDPNQQLVHRGLEIFHDARYSLDQWYSCHSCHQDGGSNSKAMDTWNDGSPLTNKTVLPLFSVSESAPWTWHGWQQSLDESLQNSFTSTMQGREVSDEDLAALRAYLGSLRLPANPHANPKAAQASSSAAARGRKLFESAEVGCAECHSGKLFTDGEVHDVGLGSQSDKYEGYNTPSLVGTYRKVRWLHDGRAKSLEQVLEKYHKPSEIGGGQELNQEQRSDLVEYLKTL